MYCVDCGKELAAGAGKCAACGRHAVERRESREATRHYGTIAFLVATLSWPCWFASLAAFGFALGAAAVVFGIYGLKDGDRRLAVAGIVVGGLSMLWLPVLRIFRVLF